MQSVFTTGSKAKSMFNDYRNVSQRTYTYICYANNKIARVHVTRAYPLLTDTSDMHATCNKRLFPPLSPDLPHRRFPTRISLFSPSTLHANYIPV